MIKAFTYLIGWTKLDLWYYGVRWKKGCHPNDLWTKYFTSSKYVKRVRKVHGEPDVIQIRKTFSSTRKARLWEHNVLVRLDVSNSSKWLNVHSGTNYPTNHRMGKFKGKTYEEIYGNEKAAELRISRSESNILRGARSSETKRKISKTRSTRIKNGLIQAPPNKGLKFPGTGLSGNSNPMFGKPAWNTDIPRDDQTKRKISETLRNRPIIVCPHCNKEGTNEYNMKRWHFNSCRSLA